MSSNRQDWVLRFKEEAVRHLANMRLRLENIAVEGITLIVPQPAQLDSPRIDGDENLRELYRLAHSIKGSAGMVGLDEIERVAEELERLLNRVYYNPSSFDATVPPQIEAGINEIATLLEG